MEEQCHLPERRGGTGRDGTGVCPWEPPTGAAGGCPRGALSFRPGTPVSPAPRRSPVPFERCRGVGVAGGQRAAGAPQAPVGSVPVLLQAVLAIKSRS